MTPFGWEFKVWRLEVGWCADKTLRMGAGWKRFGPLWLRWWESR